MSNHQMYIIILAADNGREESLEIFNFSKLRLALSNPSIKLELKHYREEDVAMPSLKIFATLGRIHAEFPAFWPSVC